MNLWRMELTHLFRSWRGWLLLSAYFLASPLAIVSGIFIERSYGFPHDQVIDFYILFTLPASLMFIGIVVSSLSFDSNRDSSLFLRIRFSVKQILIAKTGFYFALNGAFFLAGLAISFVFGIMIFDSSDSISLAWMLWGLFFYFTGGIFWIGLMSFTSAMFTSSVASVLLTLAIILGIPVISGVLTTIELLMRGLIETPPNNWQNVSYVAKIMEWWPAGTGDATAFFGVTQSEIAAGKIIVQFQEVDLDPFFRVKPLISSLLTTPLLMAYAWRKFSTREI